MKEKTSKELKKYLDAKEHLMYCKLCSKVFGRANEVSDAKMKEHIKIKHSTYDSKNWRDLVNSQYSPINSKVRT